MEASHNKKHRPHIKVGKDAEEGIFQNQETDPCYNHIWSMS